MNHKSGVGPSPSAFLLRFLLPHNKQRRTLLVFPLRRHAFPPAPPRVEAKGSRPFLTCSVLVIYGTIVISPRLLWYLPVYRSKQKICARCCYYRSRLIVLPQKTKQLVYSSSTPLKRFFFFKSPNEAIPKPFQSHYITSPTPFFALFWGGLQTPKSL